MFAHLRLIQRISRSKTKFLQAATQSHHKMRRISMRSKSSCTFPKSNDLNTRIALKINNIKLI